MNMSARHPVGLSPRPELCRQLLDRLQARDSGLTHARRQRRLHIRRMARAELFESVYRECGHELHGCLQSRVFGVGAPGMQPDVYVVGVNAGNLRRYCDDQPAREKLSRHVSHVYTRGAIVMLTATPSGGPVDAARAKLR